MTHVIELEIKRFYRVYVTDPTNSMTNDQLVEKAKELAMEDEKNIEIDAELEIEEDDILSAHYEYEVPDRYDD